MTMTRIEAEGILQAGLSALRRGDPAESRRRFDRLVDAGDGFDPPWLLLAQACRQLRDDAGEERALTRQLEMDKRDLPALLAMGELKVRKGDDRAANSFFRAALNSAAVSQPVPPALAPMLQKARDFLGTAQRRFEAHLLDTLAASGTDARGGARVRHALDLMLGKVELYQQQPSSFYFPGLPQRYFYEREEFQWLGGVEAAIPAMQEELEGVLSAGQPFDPYIVATPDRPFSSNPLLNDPSWGAFYFWRSGRIVEENAARCPRTMAALEMAPIPVIAGRSPMALYSVLKPGTHIQPHNGMLNTRLICHIPLVTPGQCGLRVGSEVREWRAGEALIFDDSIEHEAWNRSDRTRVILLFEIWRPEIGEAERAALTRIFEAIGDYEGVPSEDHA